MVPRHFLSRPFAAARVWAAHAALPRRVELLTARATFLALLLAGTLGMTTAAAAANPIGPAGLDVPAAEAQFLDALNADRTANGLAPLPADSRLMDVARWRSEDMASRNFFSHDLGGYTVFQVLKDRQIAYTVAGENLCVNTYDESRTVSAAEASLMKSAEHRSNILRPEFNLVGVGIAAGRDQQIFFTQIFIQSSSS